MTVVGYGSLLTVFLLMFLVPAQRLSIPPALILATAVVRAVAAMIAVVLVSDWNADAYLYYFDTLGYTLDPIEPGTSFVAYLVLMFRTVLNASFDDMMLIFSLPGIVGIFILMRFIGSMFKPYKPEIAVLIFFLLPGFHFWTSWVNKDGLSCLGIVLMIVGASRMPSRIWMVVLGLIVLTAVRPHIAALGLAAFGIAYGLSARAGKNVIVVLPLMLLAGMAATTIFQTFLGINIFNINEIMQLLQDRQTYLSTTTELDVTYIANPGLRLVSFLFQPLFFDARNGLSLVASFENAAFLILCGRVVIELRRGHLLGEPLVRFLGLFAITMALLLGLTSYNVGLALRQKVMLYPVMIALLAIARAEYYHRGGKGMVRKRTSARSAPASLADPSARVHT